MIFLEPRILNLKVGDKVKELEWNGDILYSFKSTIIEVSNAYYLSDNYAWYDLCGLSDTLSSIYNMCHFCPISYKAMVCNKISRILQI